jgi:sugar phosphate isomerase/epimerase
MTDSFGRLALHTWTIDTTDLKTALDAIRQAGYAAAELRRTDFKRCYEAGMSNDDVLALIKASGVPVGVLGVEYGWLFATGDDSRRLFDDLRISCANAIALDCPMLMCAPGPWSGPLHEAVDNLRAAAEIAEEHGLKLAIEFNSQHEVLNSLEVQRELVATANRDNVGLLLDAYHLARSGRPGRGFEEVPGEEIMHFQYSDLPEHPATGVKRPTDRLPPGQGVIRWREVFGLLSEKGYTGLISYEAPNPALWARSPYEVCREGIALTRTLIENATGA